MPRTIEIAFNAGVDAALAKFAAIGFGGLKSPQTALLKSMGGAKTPTPKPVQYGRAGEGSRMQGVGEKMRAETSQALEEALKHGMARKRGVSVEEIRRQEAAKIAALFPRDSAFQQAMQRLRIRESAKGSHGPLSFAPVATPSPFITPPSSVATPPPTQPRSGGGVRIIDDRLAPSAPAAVGTMPGKAQTNPFAQTMAGRPSVNPLGQTWPGKIGSLGKEAAESCDRCKVCGKKATTKVLWAEGHGYQPACDDHKEQVAKPYKDKDDFSGFRKYKAAADAAFSLSTSALRQEPRERPDYSPGKGRADAGGAGHVVDSKVTRAEPAKRASLGVMAAMAANF